MTLFSPEKFVVHVDPDLKDLVPDYLKKRREDITLFETALQQNDYDTIFVMGHCLKGSGAGYGFLEITQLGLTIESAAQRKDAVLLRKSLERLARFLENVKVVYD